MGEAGLHEAASTGKAAGFTLIDLVFGILLPVAAFIAALMLAVNVGGYTVVGNFIWRILNGGNPASTATIANPTSTSGPSAGALSGALFTLLWGGLAYVFFRFSRRDGRIEKFAMRILTGFFAGLAAWSAWFAVYSAQGNSASVVLGSGGGIDVLFSQFSGIAANLTPKGS